MYALIIANIHVCQLRMLEGVMYVYTHVCMNLCA